MTTFLLVIDTSNKKVVRVPCIYYLVQFQKSQEHVKALFDSGSKVNTMNPTFAQKLGLYIRKTNIGAQKIDSSVLETFGMIIADLKVEDKAGRFRFF